MSENLLSDWDGGDSERPKNLWASYFTNPRKIVAYLSTNKQNTHVRIFLLNCIIIFISVFIIDFHFAGWIFRLNTLPYHLSSAIVSSLILFISVHLSVISSYLFVKNHQKRMMLRVSGYLCSIWFVIGNLIGILLSAFPSPILDFRPWLMLVIMVLAVIISQVYFQLGASIYKLKFWPLLSLVFLFFAVAIFTLEVYLAKDLVQPLSAFIANILFL